MSRKAAWWMVGMGMGIGLVLLSIFVFQLLSVWKVPPAPTVGDYVKMTKPWEPVVVAVYDYRADHGGASPKVLGDLVPGYLPAVPADGEMMGDDLLVRVALPHTAMVYTFDPAKEGWSVEGDYGVGKLPVGKLGPSKKP